MFWFCFLDEYFEYPVISVLLSWADRTLFLLFGLWGFFCFVLLWGFLVGI